MTVARRTQILALLSTGTGTRRLCEVAAQATAVSGAGIMLFSGDLAQASLCASNQVAHLIGDAQYTLGEGPSVDAHRGGRVVVEADLTEPDPVRWQAFGPLAVAAGARAVFCFPVRVGAARLGSLDLYRDRPGPLPDDRYADAVLLADVAARVILALQAQAAPGTVALALEAGANFQLVVHQAAGMVSVQLGLSVGDALVRLRARAFSTDVPIADIARDVVSRRLRFDDSGPN